MTDHGGAASPRTEAGQRLASRELHDFDDQPVDITADIRAIEAEAAQEAPAPEGLREQDRTRIREAFGQIVRSDYDDPFPDEALGVLDAAFAATPFPTTKPQETDR